jgi:hypothetical protein
MPILAQQFREEYREEFMITLAPQLREEGMKKKAKETALRMLNRGFNLNTIIDMTGLTKSEIEALASQSRVH